MEGDDKVERKTFITNSDDGAKKVQTKETRTVEERTRHATYMKE